MSRRKSKKEDIIASAHELFWKHGIKRVTVEEICERAGCSKMTFYRQFANKTEIAKEVLKRADEEGMESYRKLMALDIPFYKKMHEIVLMKAQAMDEISQELLMDLISGTNPDLQNYFYEVQREEQNEMEADFRKAQEEGYLRKDLNIEFVMEIMNRFTEMVRDEHLQRFFDSPKQLVVEITNLYFFGITSRDKE